LRIQAHVLSLLELGKLGALKENLESIPNKWGSTISTMGLESTMGKSCSNRLVDIDHCEKYSDELLIYLYEYTNDLLLA
jgi:hypothetical protein